MIRRLFWLTLTLFIIAATGTLIWDFFLSGHDTILGLTAFTVSLITLFGTMMLEAERGRERSLTKGSLRSAIAVSIVVTYLFLVSFGIFLQPPENISPITKSFLDSFTALVGITIAFYFGASAVVQAFGKEADNKESSDKKDSEH